MRSPAGTRSAGPNAPRAPAGPPLLRPGEPLGTGEPPASAGEASAPAQSEDPLVANGLGSPSCAERGTGGLTAQAQEDCRTSGFIAAAAPTPNYGFDINIDSGPVGIDLNEVLLRYLVSPVWMGLVWIAHALIVALEWCFTIDLLRSPSMTDVAVALRHMQNAFTQPWLAAVLAIAAIAVAYHGIVRRRVAQTLAEAVVMVAMMGAGLWMAAEPFASIGAVGGWVNEASLGALGAVDRGTPSGGSQAFAEAMVGLFATAVGRPWCYMEFGDVQWCAAPSQLDQRLRSAALRLTAAGGRSGECDEGTGAGACSDPQARARWRSYRLVRSAQTNGALFLALPADGPERNSISQSGSLLHALCQSFEATHCVGATAPQAEFRTGSGTWSRFEGLLLIVAGALGLLLLLGFIALRLLEAAIVALLYLLLAPVVLLAPAFGANGRDAFRRWGMRLLGAIVAKLLYSVLLGVVLMLGRVLTTMPSLGWWVQWLLVSTLWWGAWRHRHRLVSFGMPSQAAPHHSPPALLGRRLAATVPLQAYRSANHAREKFNDWRKRRHPAGGGGLPRSRLTGSWQAPRDDQASTSPPTPQPLTPQPAAPQPTAPPTPVRQPATPQPATSQQGPPSSASAPPSPARTPATAPVPAPRARPQAPADGSAPPVDPVMRDAREVAQRRKRQLGLEPGS